MEDIKTGADNTIKYFAIDKLTLDYSLNSLKIIDDFFEKNCKDGKALEGGELSKNLGVKLFAMGSYVGETIIKNVPGSRWKADDSEPENEVKSMVILPDGSTIWPIQKTIKRFRNGYEDSIYPYGYHMVINYANKSPENNQSTIATAPSKKTWWKFWSN